MPAPDPRAILGLLIILFIVFSPDPQGARAAQARPRLYAILEAEERALSTFNSSHYGDFEPSREAWLNLTGFTSDSEYSWSSLPSVKERAKQLSLHAIGADNENVLTGASGQGSLDGLYQNVTGMVHGTWTRSALTSTVEVPSFNMTQFYPIGPFGPMQIDGFGRNLTSKEGSLKIRFEEHDDLDKAVVGRSASSENVVLARKIRASLDVGVDTVASDGWAARLHGVHFAETGSILLTTTSEKYDGIFALPHLAAYEHQYDLARELLNDTLRKTIDQQSQGFAPVLHPWTSVAEGTVENQYTVPNCELVVYLQLQRQSLSTTLTSTQTSFLMRLIEEELRHPTGVSLPAPYDLHFSMLAFSPDCGYVIESKGPPEFAPQEGNHLVGPKAEVEYLQGRHHLLIFSAVLALQLWLLTTQMQEASTPSTRSRISFYTISMLSMGDGFTTMTLSLLSLFMPDLWVLSMTAAFLAFLSVSFFGMRFLLDIWTVQLPEQERREQNRRAAATAAQNLAGTNNRPVNAPLPATVVPPNQPRAESEPEGLPLPATARRPTDNPANPVLLPYEPGTDTLNTDPNGPPTDPTQATVTTTRPSSFGALYTRFYFLLLATLFLSLNATSWPSPVRRGYFTVLAMLYLSFWVPQIARNAMRNCRRALRWDFVAGQSLLRLVPFAYFYGYSANALFARVDYVDLSILVTWVWLQCLMLASQEIIGPRWFVGNTWVPPAYDYHPVLREDEEGGRLPIGFSQASADASTSTSDTTKQSAKPGEKRQNGKYVIDCAICMQDLEVAVLGPDDVAEGSLTSGAGGLLARRAYMVTPCRHVFHTHCLEGWMKYRLQCPICREELPPL